MGSYKQLTPTERERECVTVMSANWSLIETQICRHHRKHAVGCIYVYSSVCICDNNGKETLNVGRVVDMRGISRRVFYFD